MIDRFLIVTFLVATYSLSTGTLAQTVYKCGNNYSQAPCPGGSPVDTADARSSEQKNRADSANKQSAKTADAMEKSRLAQDSRNLAGNRAGATIIAAPAPMPDAAPEQPKVIGKKKKGKPEFFTAQEPGAKKPKKTKKNTTSKTAEK